MCGPLQRRSDRQKIAEAFAVKVNLDQLDFAPEDDIAPGSFYPVVFTNNGERDMELMFWGFTFPQRFTINTRADSILKSGIWKNSFEERRCIVPADSFFEWKRLHKRNNPKYKITIPGREPSRWRGSGACGGTRKAFNAYGLHHHHRTQ
jgi:putative SOS response-associated peptidase YedK